MNTEHHTLLIRADAGETIGWGHVMRCLALAQAWQDAGGAVTFVMATDVPAVQARLEAEGMHVVQINAAIGSADDMAQTIQWASELNARWVVLDGYQFSAENQRAIKQAGFSLLWIDDNGDATHYYADIVLNQNLHAKASLYTHREPYTELLLGTRYVLLRREFLKWREWRREIPKVARKVLVTLGGSDPHNVTLMVIKALEQVKVDGLEAVVVVGASHPHIHELAQIAQVSPIPIRLEINALNMPALMAWADVAISGGGSTCWELVFMGVPNVVLVLAKNQQGVIEGLGDIGMVLNLGWYEQVTPLRIAEALLNLFATTSQAEIARKGQNLVDGMGAKRLLKTMLAQTLVLRRVSESDCELLWEWVNDPDVRESAFLSEFIPYEKHKQWFSTKLRDPLCFLFIALDTHGTPIGQIRFDVKDGEAAVDVSIARNQRGKGYGSSLIRKGVQELQRITTIHTIHAFVKPENKASINAFQRAGFARLRVEMVKGQYAVHLIYRGNG